MSEKMKQTKKYCGVRRAMNNNATFLRTFVQIQENIDDDLWQCLHLRTLFILLDLFGTFRNRKMRKTKVIISVCCCCSLLPMLRNKPRRRLQKWPSKECVIGEGTSRGQMTCIRVSWTSRAREYMTNNPVFAFHNQDRVLYLLTLTRLPPTEAEKSNLWCH